ncbi:hypothetical protein JTB14_036349 [Gonioctena quinquepunctata]|nr:hypothetical protein JTB14_036349 [Gonioctena quinquepunctata]
MVTHWESSRRPLYVRTIWKDGQHHVVLHEENSRHSQKTGKTHNTTRTVKSATVSYSSNLNVTSMKLLNNAGSTECAKTTRRCKTSVKDRLQVTPLKHLQKQVSFNIPLDDKTNTLGLAIRSNSIDISEQRTCYDGDKSDDNIARFITYNSFIEPVNDSLSERVLVWLDLATQHGNGFNQEKSELLRVVTAQPVVKKKQNNFSRHRCMSSCHPTDLNEPKSSFQVEGVSQSLQFTNRSILRNNENCNESNAIFEQSSTPELLVSSKLEENFVPGAIEDKDDFRNTLGVKRQLHIFMPDLPKKFSDCDSSVLSSKLSNCSLQKCGYTTKL